jgi:putative transposase
MSELKTHYSCAELAAMKLPGLPSTKRNMNDLAVREKWPSRKRAGRGGGFEYQPPAAIMALIKQKTINSMINGDKSDKTPHQITVVKNSSPQNLTHPAINKSTSIATLKSTSALKDWQRNTAEARISICAEVKRLAAIGGKERAIRTIVDQAALGTLPEHLQQLVAVANAKSGNGRTLSRNTLYRWLNDTEHGIAGLAPKTVESTRIPQWAPALLQLMANPQKPTLKACLDQLQEHLPSGVQAPSYYAAQRFIKKMSNVDAQRGRMGSREIKNIMPFVRRDTSEMLPTDAYTADGHTFDAEVAHRDHGKPFRPEITTVLDIATRKAVGWSAGLAESTWSVLDALRHACTSCGIPAIFYVDNGSGFKNDMMKNEVTGFLARLSITATHSTPYNSQARGIIERAHQTIWVKGAKQLPTYMGADMDAQGKQKVFKITRSDVRKTGTSPVLMPWNLFVQWCQAQIDTYNNTPHSSLPKITDSETGRKRHQTPNEAWNLAVASGAEIVPVEAHEADDLFRPYKQAKVSRGEIKLHGNIYFHDALQHHHGDIVRVGFDLHDASKIWVRNQAGQLICVAEFEANKRSYFPQSFIEQAAERRAKGRIKRAEAKIEEAMLEMEAPALIEQQPEFVMPSMAIDTPREKQERQEEKPSVEVGKTSGAVVIEMPVTRPIFNSDASKYRWLMSNPEQATVNDGQWMDWYRSTEEYEDLFGDIGVAAR